MMPSARVEIDGGKGGFRSGVLYSELPGLLRELYEQGKSAVAYHVGGFPPRRIVGRSQPQPDGLGVVWWLDGPPVQGLRDKDGHRA